MSKVVTVKNYAVAEGPSYICQTYVKYKAVLSKKNIKKETYCETFLYSGVAGAITVYSNVKKYDSKSSYSQSIFSAIPNISFKHKKYSNNFPSPNTVKVNKRVGKPVFYFARIIKVFNGSTYKFVRRWNV